MTKFIGFTGHRNRVTEESELDLIAAENPGAIWVHGGAIGFDTQVENYAKAHGIQTLVIRPDYKLYRAVPKQAPLIRNKIIVDQSQFMVACWDGRTHGGTWYTIQYAKERDRLVYLIKTKKPTT
jgi:hypothetical protein